MLAGSQGTYFVNDIALVDDWSKGGTVTGQWVMPSASITGLATSSPHCLQVGALGAVSATTFPCGNSYATGTVASVTVGTGWPSWFAPNISNPTTVPSHQCDGYGNSKFCTGEYIGDHQWNGLHAGCGLHAGNEPDMQCEWLLHHRCGWND